MNPPVENPGGKADVDERLAALYARIPDIDCIGKCKTTCTLITMSGRERERIAEAGVVIPPVSPGAIGALEPKAGPCPALTILGRCAVYTVRPVICRIWGVTEDLPCVHGCRPDRYLANAEALAMTVEALEIGGSGDYSEVELTAMKELLNHPMLNAIATAILRNGHQGDMRRAGLAAT